LAHVAWPRAQPLGQSVSLKFSLETRLESDHSSNKNDPKGGMWEVHREICLPDPNAPAAPGSSFGAHFLSVSETKSFCSTDLKLCRCLLHRLDLMQLKFCVDLNKILEVIRFLVMTVFFVSPSI